MVVDGRGLAISLDAGLASLSVSRSELPSAIDRASSLDITFELLRVIWKE